jgi:S-adenosylmethionine:tRNA ribosyltransferase-isomerase
LTTRTSDYDYTLPPERIAQRPLPQRDRARLLRLDRATGAIAHGHVLDLPDLLRPGDVLVMNDSRVIPARLIGRKPSGGRVEALLVRQVTPDTWLAMTRPGLRPGQVVDFGSLSATVTGAAADGLRRLRFDRSGEDLRRAIQVAGQMPTPPYITAPLASPDEYQTVYARVEGSVAAPTAGFHFTQALLAALRERGVQTEWVTLHVGPGTFQPVKTEDVAAHRLHAEWATVPEEVACRLNAARAEGSRIIAVGTTATRTLETAAAPDGTIQPFTGDTALFIVPGYAFRAIDGLLTNFHLPRSTLLMLVSAFAGRERVLAAYAEAIACGYRFYSFGDAMLIL